MEIPDHFYIVNWSFSLLLLMVCLDQRKKWALRRWATESFVKIGIYTQLRDTVMLPKYFALETKSDIRYTDNRYYSRWRNSRGWINLVDQLILW